jgi:hypothetical protein
LGLQQEPSHMVYSECPRCFAVVYNGGNTKRIFIDSVRVKTYFDFIYELFLLLITLCDLNKKLTFLKGLKRKKNYTYWVLLLSYSSLIANLNVS